MQNQTTNWNKQQLSAYILLYCANADFSESEEETKIILSKIQGSEYESIRKEFENDNDFEKIHAEFEQDNDYQSIQKIQAAVARLGYSKAEIDNLVSEMNNLFLADGEFAATEKAIQSGLKMILKQ